MKIKFLILPLLIIPLTSCNKELKRNSFYFDTYTETRLFEGSEEDLDNIEDLFLRVDRLTDNYRSRNINNVYTINHTSDPVEVDARLYEVLKASFCNCLEPLNYFNPLCGSLSKKWKESLENKAVLSQTTIDEELLKMASTSVQFLENNHVKKTGDAEIDLGEAETEFLEQYIDKSKVNKYVETRDAYLDTIESLRDRYPVDDPKGKKVQKFSVVKKSRTVKFIDAENDFKQSELPEEDAEPFFDYIEFTEKFVKEFKKSVKPPVIIS